MPADGRGQGADRRRRHRLLPADQVDRDLRHRRRGRIRRRPARKGGPRVPVAPLDALADNRAMSAAAPNPATDARVEELVESFSFLDDWDDRRSEEHTSELQSLMRISYAVFCLKK